MTDWTTIAETDHIERGTLPRGGGIGLKEGETLSTSEEGLLFEWASDSGYIGGELHITWPDLLKHAPSSEMWFELTTRGILKPVNEVLEHVPTAALVAALLTRPRCCVSDDNGKEAISGVSPALISDDNNGDGV